MCGVITSCWMQKLKKVFKLHYDNAVKGDKLTRIKDCQVDVSTVVQCLEQTVLLSHEPGWQDYVSSQNGMQQLQAHSADLMNALDSIERLLKKGTRKSDFVFDFHTQAIDEQLLPYFQNPTPTISRAYQQEVKIWMSFAANAADILSKLQASGLEGTQIQAAIAQFQTQLRSYILSEHDFNAVIKTIAMLIHSHKESLLMWMHALCVDDSLERIQLPPAAETMALLTNLTTFFQALKQSLPSHKALSGLQNNVNAIVSNMAALTVWLNNIFVCGAVFDKIEDYRINQCNDADIDLDEYGFIIGRKFFVYVSCMLQKVILDYYMNCQYPALNQPNPDQQAASELGSAILNQVLAVNPH